ncbi:hypothetical protein PtB15_2B790 [Puccinia triticina]|nr:hypothetical protein PtB15_2B790 [Puccinia triticina]
MSLRGLSPTNMQPEPTLRYSYDCPIWKNCATLRSGSIPANTTPPPTGHVNGSGIGGSTGSISSQLRPDSGRRTLAECARSFEIMNINTLNTAIFPNFNQINQQDAL